jgi:hypothetical protein
MPFRFNPFVFCIGCFSFFSWEAWPSSWSGSSFLSSSPSSTLLSGWGISKTRYCYRISFEKTLSNVVFSSTSLLVLFTPHPLISQAEKSQKQGTGTVIYVGKTVINVVFSLISVFLTGLLHYFFLPQESQHQGNQLLNFLQIYLTWGTVWPEPGLGLSPFIQSHSPLCTAT